MKTKRHLALYILTMAMFLNLGSGDFIACYTTNTAMVQSAFRLLPPG